MIRTDQTETVDCPECDGLGKFPTTHHCPGCDHQHIGTMDCDLCDGTGQRTYPIWIPDPENCVYCREGTPHPLFFGLPDIKATRGGIKFS